MANKKSTKKTKGVPEYRSWIGMRERCNNPKNDRYHRYGGRGIKVCKRWDSYELFFLDMGPPPTLQHTIDRIDNDGDYEPENCRWATRHEQSLNRSTSLILTVDGVSKPIFKWAEDTGLTVDQIYSRRRHGWGSEKVLKTKLIRKCVRSPAKITAEIVREIISLRSRKLSFREIAKRLNCGVSTVCQIVNGKAVGHINDLIALLPQETAS